MMVPFGDIAIIAYSTAFAGAILSILTYHFRRQLRALGVVMCKPFSTYLSYQPVFHSRRFKSQWTGADVLGELIYLGLNAFWVGFRSSSLSEAGRRAANLAVGNLIFLCASPHLDALTNTLGLCWRTVRRFHGSVGILTAALLTFHAITVPVVRMPFPMSKNENLWAVVAAASMGASLALSLPAFRNRWYEMFLRLHQCLTIMLVYGTWVHIAPQSLLPRAHVYALMGVSGLSTVFTGAIVIYRNGFLRYRLPRADVMHEKGTVLVRVSLSRPVRVEAGQYISLWVFMPSTRIRSVFECHPFVVADWSDSPLNTLDLLIEPRSGLTRHLLQRSQIRQDPCLALFSGPHGMSVPVGDYEVVLMVATGYGIAAQLPYLKKLLHQYNSRRARSRRIHLVWELKTLELAIAIQSLLNNALNDDTLDDGYILQISVYVENVDRQERISPRAEVIRGLADWSAIFQREATGQYIRRVQEEEHQRGEMIVTAAASYGVRRDLQAIVQKHVHERVKLVELDYQLGE